MKDFDVIAENILDWASDRNLICGTTPEKQMLKLQEEVGELAASIARGDHDKIRDDIGHCVVVLTILAAQLQAYLPECLELAYHEIKDRRGMMIDGVFIKEEDLK